MRDNITQITVKSTRDDITEMIVETMKDNIIEIATTKKIVDLIPRDILMTETIQKTDIVREIIDM